MVRRPSRRGSCFATILPPASPPPGPTSRQRVIAESRCVENRLFDSVDDGSSSTAFSSTCTKGRATVPHAIHDMVAGRIGRVHRPVPNVAVQVPALRVLRIGSDHRRIRTRKPSQGRSIIPRSKKVHPSLAISDLPRELLLHAVARPKQQARGAPRIPSRNLFPKRQIILPRHHVPTPIR